MELEVLLRECRACRCNQALERDMKALFTTLVRRQQKLQLV